MRRILQHRIVYKKCDIFHVVLTSKFQTELKIQSLKNFVNSIKKNIYIYTYIEVASFINYIILFEL